MSPDPSAERLRRGAGPGWGDAVTFTWGDEPSAHFGSLRLGVAEAGVSLLALLFADGALGASAIESGATVNEPTWESIRIGDVAARIERPLEAWHVAWDGAQGGWDLAFSALTPPLAVGAAGVAGYEQGCRVTGTVRVGERQVAVDCLGQRGHQWGEPDWDRVALSRTVSAWLDPDRFVCVGAVRPAGAEGHAEEEMVAWLITPDAAEPARVDEARLSTSYDGEGRPVRAGLELWPEPGSAYPQRVGGEAACGTSLELGRLRLDAAFFTWRMDGRRGVGRYDVMRRA